jgi:hypothetical protein
MEKIKIIVILTQLRNIRVPRKSHLFIGIEWIIFLYKHAIVCVLVAIFVARNEKGKRQSESEPTAQVGSSPRKMRIAC